MFQPVGDNRHHRVQASLAPSVTCPHTAIPSRSSAPSTYANRLSRSSVALAPLLRLAFLDANWISDTPSLSVTAKFCDSRVLVATGWMLYARVLLCTWGSLCAACHRARTRTYDAGVGVFQLRSLSAPVLLRASPNVCNFLFRPLARPLVLIVLCSSICRTCHGFHEPCRLSLRIMLPLLHTLSSRPFPVPPSCDQPFHDTYLPPSHLAISYVASFVTALTLATIYIFRLLL